MTEQLTAFHGVKIFDGQVLFTRSALIVSKGVVKGIVPEAEIPTEACKNNLGDGYLTPEFVDLQVNGGGGVMLNDEPSVNGLAIISQAHKISGTGTILPTLVTDTMAKTNAAINAVEEAIRAGMTGIGGLHLEGPHLSRQRKGAHNPDLIRAMGEDDMRLLLDAAKRLPILKVTFAPESVGADRIRTLARAGILLSIGHSEASYDECKQAVTDGARCVTHLFNAMSQFGSREPGVVGAALSIGKLSAGLIVDMNHVHPETVKLALRAKKKPGEIFLVSDSMSVVGTDMTSFDFFGRQVLRKNGRLTLGDGTLAGADLTLVQAVKNLVQVVGVPVKQALAMASSIPAKLLGSESEIGTIKPGQKCRYLHLSKDLDIIARIEG